MAAQSPLWRLGTIGFGYDGWQGTVYPQGVPAARRLAVYAQQFPAVELDTTFYAVPRPEVVRRWADATPEHFRFCLKTPRDVTHEGRIGQRPTLDAMLAFIDTLRELGDKLGVVLLQFPARWRNQGQHLTELEIFLRALPKDVAYAVEFRHGSWWTKQVASVFRGLHERAGMRIAWVGADQPTEAVAGVSPDDEAQGGKLHRPRPVVVVGDFMYLRWVGIHGQFPGDEREQVDPTPRLQWWASRLQPAVREGTPIREVYGFFGNSYAGHAPGTLRRFTRLMGLPEPAPPPAARQGSLF